MIDKLGSFPAPGTLPSAPRGDGVAAASQTATSDFTSMLTDVLGSAVENLRAGETAAAAGIMGKAPLQEVVDKVIAAEHSLQAAIAVRDKIVSAYLEVSRMTI